jgi:hypothetical protein
MMLVLFSSVSFKTAHIGNRNLFRARQESLPACSRQA